LRRAHAVLPPFILTIPILNRELVNRLRRDLDEGEAEAIALILEKRGDLLLIDERKGRRVARREGVSVITSIRLSRTGHSATACKNDGSAETGV